MEADTIPNWLASLVVTIRLFDSFFPRTFLFTMSDYEMDPSEGDLRVHAWTSARMLSLELCRYGLRSWPGPGGETQRTPKLPFTDKENRRWIQIWFGYLTSFTHLSLEHRGNPNDFTTEELLSQVHKADKLFDKGRDVHLHDIYPLSHRNCQSRDHKKPRSTHICCWWPQI